MIYTRAATYKAIILCSGRYIHIVLKNVIVLKIKLYLITPTKHIYNSN